jgi:hypothetical protein
VICARRSPHAATSLPWICVAATCTLQEPPRCPSCFSVPLEVAAWVPSPSSGTHWAHATSDAGPRALARALTANCALTHLDLRNNRIGSAGIASLAEGLHQNTTLVTFDLRWNSAGPSGAHALEAALAHNRALLRLMLQGNRVPEDGLKRIQRLLARNCSSRSLNSCELSPRARAVPMCASRADVREPCRLVPTCEPSGT